MTMLTHARGLGPASHSVEKQPAVGAGAAAAHSAVIRRFGAAALAILAAGGVFAAIMALKVAIYLPRFIHL